MAASLEAKLFSLNLMHFVSVVGYYYIFSFFFAPPNVAYHLTIANVPPVVHVPQDGNPWSIAARVAIKALLSGC